MYLVNSLGSLIASPNTGAVIGLLVPSMAGIILVSIHGSLPGTLSITLMGAPLWLWFGCEVRRY